MADNLDRATPRPWSIDGGGARALVRGDDLTIVAVRHRLDAETHSANAALIVKAVNAYDDMLKALKMVSGIDLPHEILDAVDAAIKKALGEAIALPTSPPEKGEGELVAALGEYMSQFGQALEAHGIPYGPAQKAADEKARAALAKHATPHQD